MADTGRPPKFSSAKELDELSKQWWDSVKETDDVPDIEGWAVHLDTTRKTLFEYEKKPEFSNTIKRWKDKIFAAKKQLALKGKINPAIFIFDAVNNTDYVNASQAKVDQNNTGVITIKTVSYKDSGSDDNSTAQV